MTNAPAPPKRYYHPVANISGVGVEYVVEMADDGTMECQVRMIPGGPASLPHPILVAAKTFAQALYYVGLRVTDEIRAEMS